MKQTASHSQTPTFVKNESNTTQFLHQPPTAANTIQYKSKSGLVRASIAAIIFGASITSGVVSCSVAKPASAAQVEHIVKAGVKP